LISRNVGHARRNHHTTEAKLRHDEAAKKAGLARAVQSRTSQRRPPAKTLQRRANRNDLPMGRRIEVAAGRVVTVTDGLTIRCYNDCTEGTLVDGKRSACLRQCQLHEPKVLGIQHTGLR
jgi:hypothetical protein